MAQMTCPRCWRTFPHETRVCPEDGNLLVASELLSRHEPLLPGTMVGDYRIEALLGEGGMGEVYGAVQPLIERRVAIKVLKSTQRELVGRFIREARSVNQIRHRNLIDIFTFGQLPDGRCYFVMEYLEGSSLADELRARGALPIGEALEILRSLASTLDAVHTRDVAHRDLKPANIFLQLEPGGGPRRVKLLDFGIAKLLGPAELLGELTELRTKPGIFMGTPQYMAPELFSGASIDFKQVDRYALGVIAYQLITGELPHQGERFGELVANILLAPPLPPSQVASLSPAIDGPLLRAIARDPSGRFGSATAMVGALDQAVREAGGEGAFDALRASAGTMAGPAAGRIPPRATDTSLDGSSLDPGKSGAPGEVPAQAAPRGDTLIDDAPPGWSSPLTMAIAAPSSSTPSSEGTRPGAEALRPDARAGSAGGDVSSRPRQRRWLWAASTLLVAGAGTLAALRAPTVLQTTRRGDEVSKATQTERSSPAQAPGSHAAGSSIRELAAIPAPAESAPSLRSATALPVTGEVRHDGPKRVPANGISPGSSQPPLAPATLLVRGESPSPAPRPAAPGPEAAPAASGPSSVATVQPAPGPSRLGRIQVGAKLPRVAGLTLDSHTALSADALLKQPGASGLLVQLWATWCAPCVDELAQLSAGRQRLDDAGMRVLLVNVLEEPEVIEPFIARHHLAAFPLIRDATGAMLEKLGLSAAGEKAVTLPLSIVADEQ